MTGPNGEGSPSRRIPNEGEAAFRDKVRSYLGDYVPPPLPLDAKAWQIDSKDHVDPSIERTAAEQLSFMTDLLGEFDLRVSTLNRKQTKNLEANAEAHPGRRLFPAMLGAVAARPQLANPNKDSILHKIMRVHAALWMPHHAPTFRTEASAVSRLWLPEVTTVKETDGQFIKKEDRGTLVPQIRPHALRYKSPNGNLVSRSTYIAAMQAKGDIAQDAQGTAWTFPLLSLDRLIPDLERVYRDPTALFKDINYIVSPEARIGLQVVQLLAGSPIHEDVIHPTNEVVAELNSNNHSVVRHIRGVTGITRSDEGSFFRHTSMSLPLPDWQPSSGVSALQVVKK